MAILRVDEAPGAMSPAACTSKLFFGRSRRRSAIRAQNRLRDDPTHRGRQRSYISYRPSYITMGGRRPGKPPFYLSNVRYVGYVGRYPLQRCSFLFRALGARMVPTSCISCIAYTEIVPAKPSPNSQANCIRKYARLGSHACYYILCSLKIGA